MPISASLPSIPILRNKDGFPQWDRALKSHLAVAECLEFIKEDVENTRPTTAIELKEWKKGWYTAYALISGSVSNNIMLDLTTAGYTNPEDEMNPYYLYKKIATIVLKESEARAEILTIEIFNLRSYEYNDIKTFLDYLIQL